jgi:hypothetical protein
VEASHKKQGKHLGGAGQASRRSRPGTWKEQGKLQVELVRPTKHICNTTQPATASSQLRIEVWYCKLTQKFQIIAIFKRHCIPKKNIQ